MMLAFTRLTTAILNARSSIHSHPTSPTAPDQGILRYLCAYFTAVWCLKR
jgi:hypothetical protein